MSLILTKPDVKLPWASQGNRAEPTSDKQLEGWVQEIPPHEMENWIQYKQDLAIKYLYQEGIPEWDNSFEYNITSYVKYNGLIYKLKSGAEVPSINKQPDTETTSWEVAFEPFGTSAAQAEEIRKIKELEGYLTLYVSKSAPVMEGIAISPEFQATPEGGHTFQGSGSDTGMFLNSNNEPEFKVNNVTKATVRNSPSLSSSDTTVVTTSMLQQFQTNLMNMMFPIGISIITQDQRNPAEYLNFGVWERDLQGKALVGVTTDVTSASPDWVKSVNREEGEYEHQLTIEEMPSHNHGVNEATGTVGPSRSVDLNSNAPEGISTTVVQPTGGGLPHNNVQPSQTKYIFTRVG